MKSTAQIDGIYRYTLDRVWREDLPQVLWVLLNPSVARADKDDPTIRRVSGFTLRWGFGGFRVVNLFAYVTPYPGALRAARAFGADVIGPRNFDVLIANIDNYDHVIVGWGGNGGLMPEESIAALFHGKTPKCLGIGKQTGQPIHPLYVPYDRQLINYDVTKYVANGREFLNATSL